jgi:hypothetical protein
VARLASVLVLLWAGCGEDGGIGISLLGVQHLVRSQGREQADVSLFVSRDCFYSVTVGGVLLASGRWKAGERHILIRSDVLEPCDNQVRVQVGAVDGSSGTLDVTVMFCEEDGCPGECSNDPPDAGPIDEPDSGPIDPYPGPLCDPCTDSSGCGDVLNLCVSVDGSPQGLCGEYCGDTFSCLDGFECLDFYDGGGNYVTSVCLPWPPAPTCP